MVVLVRVASEDAVDVKPDHLQRGKSRSRVSRRSERPGLMASDRTLRLFGWAIGLMVSKRSAITELHGLACTDPQKMMAFLRGDGDSIGLWCSFPGRKRAPNPVQTFNHRPRGCRPAPSASSPPETVP